MIRPRSRRIPSSQSLIEPRLLFSQLTLNFTLDAARRIGIAFEDAAGGWLIIAIAAAPWMYGSTRHWAIVRLCVLLGCMASYWVAGLILQWRWPRLPRKVGWAVLFLLISGWLTVLAGSLPAPDAFATSHFAMLYERFPGSFIVKTPRETMWLFSGLLAAMCVTIDLSAERSWRIGFCAAMSIVGASIVILGFVQIATGASAILWNHDMQSNGFFFATFFHRSLATPFINLVWPLSAALLLSGVFRTTKSQWRKGVEVVLWGALSLISFGGLAAQDSRFGQLNGLVLICLLFIWILWRRPMKLRALLIRSVIIAIILFCLLAITAFKTGKYTQIAERWHMLLPPQQTSVAPMPVSGGLAMSPNMFLESTDPNYRVFLGAQRLVAATCFRMLPQSGLLGFGPGTWSSTYTHFTNDTFLRTFYLHLQFAHNDYLQTVVEWGVLGAAGWGLLVFGALEAGVRRLYANRINKQNLTRDEAIAFGCALALVGVLLHALLDFPLQIPSIQLYTCVLVGLLWASRLRGVTAQRVTGEHED